MFNSIRDSDGSFWEPLEPEYQEEEEEEEEYISYWQSQETIEVILASHSSLGVKENERAAAAVTTPSLTQKTKADSVESCKVIVRAQLEASCTAAGTTCQIRKRKIDKTVDTNLKLPHYSDKENVLLSLSLDRTPVATIKRIRREKTGTDWQTVLDVVKYGEEQQKKTPAVIEDK
ncbi:uncharacterized protein BJ212DRAFT_1477398 [Suillus subaureus]|uniref:Uncharacterized protein n=1 Tax=Suillus subaureus TaxID=48587 RepID=A0A9P7EJJ3_9AGAM|nr:uncharacterized protein BJ212DRAFT_1477398 [Suillus subaureus]KAG1822993.1 hypothetical protein BJ212DRAFT_1477398 [Suillus subaureus]